MTVPNSLVVIVPSPSLSKSEKASLNSAKQNQKFYRNFVDLVTECYKVNAMK